MKKFILAVSVLSAMFLLANCFGKAKKVNKVNEAIVEIPDANFKSFLLENFDTNRDGNISLPEAKVVKKLDCSGKNIKSLDGIEKFENLEYLDCSNNQLNELEVRYNKKLNRLICTKNNNPLMVYFGMSSPLKNKNFQRPEDNATPDIPSELNPIDKNKCTYDEDKTIFSLNFND